MVVGTGSIEGNLAPILKVSPSAFINDLPQIFKQFADYMKASGCSSDVLGTFKKVVSRYVRPTYVNNTTMLALLYDLASTYPCCGDRFEAWMLIPQLTTNKGFRDLRYALSAYIYQHAHNIDEGLYDYMYCEGAAVPSPTKCTKEYINNKWYYTISASTSIGSFGRSKEGAVTVFSRNNIGFILPFSGSPGLHIGIPTTIYFRLCNYKDSSGEYVGISPTSIKVTSCNNCTLKQYGADYIVIVPTGPGPVRFEVTATDPSGREYTSALPILLEATPREGISVTPSNVRVHAGESFKLTVSSNDSKYVIRSILVDVCRGNVTKNTICLPQKSFSVNSNTATLTINTPGEYTIRLYGFAKPDHHLPLGSAYVHVVVTNPSSPKPSPTPSPHPVPPFEGENKPNVLAFGALLWLGWKLIK